MKNFLTSFAAVATGFAAQTATAAVQQEAPRAVPVEAQAVVSVAQPENLTLSNNGDIFNFVLRRSGDTGLMMADHESHSSHSSHSSHYSGYNDN